jgi:hypothetical protein
MQIRNKHEESSQRVCCTGNTEPCLQQTPNDLLSEKTCRPNSLLVVINLRCFEARSDGNEAKQATCRRPPRKGKSNPILPLRVDRHEKQHTDMPCTCQPPSSSRFVAASPSQTRKKTNRPTHERQRGGGGRGHSGTTGGKRVDEHPSPLSSLSCPSPVLPVSPGLATDGVVGNEGQQARGHCAAGKHTQGTGQQTSGQVVLSRSAHCDARHCAWLGRRTALSATRPVSSSPLRSASLTLCTVVCSQWIA